MKRSGILLLAIVALGLWLRLLGISHGIGAHPDERHMVMVTLDLDPSLKFTEEFPYLELSGFNPKSFAYGSLPYYLNRFAAETGSALFSIPISYDNLFYYGRALCLFFGVAAIPLLYLVTRHFYRDESIALTAAALLALNPLHIQLSRFFTVDVILTTLVLACVYALTRYLQSGSWSSLIAASVMCGSAIGTKVSGITLLAPILAAVAFKALSHGQLCSFSLVLRSGVAVMASAATFVLVEPFAIFDFDQCYKQIVEQLNMAKGAWRPPYTIQYVGTTPYIYPLAQMLWYTMGPPVFLACIFGTIIRTTAIVIAPFSESNSRVRAAEALYIIWALMFFFSTAGLMVKYPRYLLPIYPLLLACGAAFLVGLGRWLFSKLVDSSLEVPAITS